MRKILLTTTALVALGSVAAVAADVSISGNSRFRYNTWSDDNAAVDGENNNSMTDNSGIFGIQKLFQRVKRHPRGTPLLFQRGDTYIDDLDLDKARLIEPTRGEAWTRQLPYIAHAGIPAVGFQQGVFIALDHQRFEYQLTSCSQFVF